MKPLITQFFKYLEDIGEHKIPLTVKLTHPNQFKLTPEDLYVKGDLDLDETTIKFNSFPDNLEVEGSLILGDGARHFTSLPKNLKVGGVLNIFGTNITSLPKGLKVGGYLDLGRTKITSLPNDLEVGGNLYIEDSSLLPKSDNEIRKMAPGIEGKIMREFK